MAGVLFTGIYSGMIVACADPTIPPGWLVCDGSLQSKTTYADLFSVIGHTYNGGVDPGGNQFKLPDFVNRFPRGAANTASAGGYDGASTHTHTFTPTLSAATVTGGAHNHSPAGGFNIAPGGDHSHVANFSGTSAAGGVNSARQTANTGQTLAGTASHHTHPTPASANTNNSGSHSHGIGGGNIVDGGGAHNHVPNNVSNPSITTLSFSNDPPHNVVQYLIKT